LAITNANPGTPYRFLLDVEIKKSIPHSSGSTSYKPKLLTASTIIIIYKIANN